MPAEKLDRLTRAEDILLGALGYDAPASIVEVHKTNHGYAGCGRYEDGERFEFESTEDLQSLEIWALEVMADKARSPGATTSSRSIVTLGASAKLPRPSLKG